MKPEVRFHIRTSGDHTELAIGPGKVALLEAIDQLGHEDPVLAHSIVFALIEIGDASLLRNALAFPRKNIQRAALVALSQLKPSTIQSKDVVAFLSSPDPGIRRTAAGIGGAASSWWRDILRRGQRNDCSVVLASVR